MNMIREILSKTKTMSKMKDNFIEEIEDLKISIELNLILFKIY
jgi:hypothetical protein